MDLTPEQIKKYSMKFAPLINPQLTCFVMNEQNELVAFGVSAPSIAEAMKKSRGRLFPTGWVRVLHAFRKMTPSTCCSLPCALTCRARASTPSSSAR